MIGIISAALDEAQVARDKAGRSEQGRKLAILATKLEDALAWALYANPDRPEAGS